MAEPFYASDRDPVAPVRLDVPDSPPAAPSGWLRTGVVLMAISLVLWFPLPAIPFLPLSFEARAGLGGSMLLGAEITFWLGAVLAGPDVLRRCKGWLRDKLRKRRVRASR